MNGLGTEGKWYEFNFDYKNIDRHLVMAGIQTASSGAGSLVNDPSTSKALSTFVQGSLMTLYDYSRGNSLQDSYLNNMNWNGMMVNMSDLGNQMGQMMRAGMQNEKAKHENEQAGKATSNANHDPFNMADTMLGGILLSLGGALGQTQRQITDKIAGSALGSAVGELYSGSMLDTAVSGVSKGFSATRDYINGSIETVKGWGGGVLDSLGVTDVYQRGKNFITGNGLKTNIEVAMEAYEKEMGRQNAVAAAFGEMARQDMAAQVAGLGAHGTKNVFDVNYVVSKTMGLSSQETMDAMKLIFGVASADELQKKLSSGEITMKDVLDKTGVSQNMNAMAGFANEYVDTSQARVYKNYIAAEKAKQKQLQAQAEQNAQAKDNTRDTEYWVRQGGSLVLGCLPIIGDLKDAQELITGKDLITKEKLDGYDKMLTMAGLTLPFIPGKGFRLARRGITAAFENSGEIADTSMRVFKRFDGMANDVDNLDEIGNVNKLDVKGGSKLDYVATGHNTDLDYDISKWSEYGLPSDGYFSRMIPSPDYQALKRGEWINLSGNKGAGFISSAEELYTITKSSAMSKAMAVEYKPDYLLEFQLNSPKGLQNLLQYDDPMFRPGGKTLNGFKEFNVPGISSDDIINWRIRKLEK